MECNRVCTAFARYYLAASSDAQQVIQEVSDDASSGHSKDLFHLLQHIQTTAEWNSNPRLLDLHSRVITKLKGAPRAQPGSRQPGSPLLSLPQDILDIIGRYIDIVSAFRLKKTCRAGRLLAQSILLNDTEMLNQCFSMNMVTCIGATYFNGFLASCPESFYIDAPLHLTIDARCIRYFYEIQEDINALQEKFPIHALTIEDPLIDGENFRKLMESLPNLKYLSVAGCRSIQPGDFQYAIYSEFLEEVTFQNLRIDDNGLYALCKRCPLLKRIVLRDCLITCRGALTAPVGKFLEVFDATHEVDINTLQELFDQVRIGTLPNAVGLYTLAKYLVFRGESLEQARHLLDEACKISPKFTVALFQRALMAYKNQDMAQVKSDLEVIVTVRPDYRAELAYFGHFFLKAFLTGEASDAELQRKFYKRILHANPDDRMVRFNWALACMLQGHHKEAKAHFEKYLEHISSCFAVNIVKIIPEYLSTTAKMLSLVLEDDRLIQKYFTKLRILFKELFCNHPDCPEFQEAHRQFLQKAP